MHDFLFDSVFISQRSIFDNKINIKVKKKEKEKTLQKISNFNFF